MSVINMLCFDGMPSRANVTQGQLDAEGLTMLNLYPANSSFGIGTNKDRQALAVWFNYYSSESYYDVNRTANIINGKTIRSFVGNQPTLTRAVFGVRVEITVNGAAMFAGGSQRYMAFFDGINMDIEILKQLPAGDHFMEFEIDYENKLLNSYLNGALHKSTPYNAMSLDSSFSLGITGVHSRSATTTIVAYLNDVYLTYDLKNGERAGVLGPVRVRNLLVEETDLPPTWLSADDTVATYVPFDGGSWTAHGLLPRVVTELDYTGQWLHEVTPAAPAGHLIASLLADDTQRCYVSNVNNTTPITFTTTFPSPKKVAGYIFQGYNISPTADEWKFQGSHDGTTWVDLDTRVGMSAWYTSVPYRKGVFKIPVQLRQAFTRYRLAITKSVAANARIEFCHYNLLGEMEDMAFNSAIPALYRPGNTALSDLDFPVVRPSIDETEGSFGFKIPTLGPSDVLAVKVGLAMRKEQGSSEKLQAKIQVGANATAKVDYDLKAHTQNMVPLGLWNTAPDGSIWTQEGLEALRVVMNTKRGAN